MRQKNPQIWREFRNERNKISKNIEKNKTNFIKKKFSNCVDKWRFLKNYNDKPTQQLPNNICYNGQQVKSPKEIARIANEFFIEKIKYIRKKFTPSNCDPIKLLESLIPRNNRTF